MIDKKLIREFSIIVGYLNIALTIESLDSVSSEYKKILNEILGWIKYYYKNNNLNIITHDRSLEIHNLLDEIKWSILLNNKIGIESLLTDEILIRYEVIMKLINRERGVC